MGRPTVHDIAKEAGVSLATVDRVLNTRPGVRPTTIERVQAAIARLGYVRDLSAANLARQRQYRFAFVLPEGPSQFVATLRMALIEAGRVQAAERVSVTILTAPAHDPHAVARTLSGLGVNKVDGLAIMMPETPQVRDAVARLKAAGLPVVTLVSDLPQSGRDHFVGINSLAAGRTAGLLMGRFVRPRPARVLVVTNSMLSRDSVERRLGFDRVIAEEFADIEVLPSIESHDDPQRMAAVVAAAMGTWRDVGGVYSLALGNQPLLEALRATGRLRELVVIAHELTPATRKALIDREVDAVITQNAGHLARSALRVLKAKCDGVDIFRAQEQIRLDIVIRENLP